jgi:uncharacterized pyridoxamine 5'-phosphate oxidase family protein
MNETPGQIAELQALLDRSIAGPSRHLTSIVEPGRRTLSAERLIEAVRGICVLNVATTTARGEPRLSAVDGHFISGHWYFSTAADALKTRHLRVRPALSVGYTPRDGFGVWAHGHAVFLEPGSVEWRMLDDHLRLMYGQSPEEWAGEVVYLRVDADWMIGFAMTDDEMAEYEQAIAAREQRIAAADDKEHR